MSTALARMVTGLSDSEVQHIYHALKREGGHLPAPTETERRAWEARQQDLLDRASRMSDKRRDALRDKVFRARSEDLDGPTFYAMSRIEARARQEVAVRGVEAIDLAPAGSQRDLYELDEHGLPAKVWYASYGSNLHRDRFLVYVKGGRPEGSSRYYDGCRDSEIPDEDIAIRIPGARPHFALSSRVWNGGIAFIDTAKGETATGLGRAYKVTRGQFEDVVAQENGARAGQCAPIPYAEVFDTSRVVTGQGPYETLLHIGDHDGAPVLTFTAPFSTRDALGRTGEVDRKPVGQNKPVKAPVKTNKPSPAYLRMIGSGLAETFGMDEVAQADYLRGCPGGDQWTRKEIVQILRSPNPPRASYTSSYGSGSYGSGSYGSSYGSSSWRGSSWSGGTGGSSEAVGTLQPGASMSTGSTGASSGTTVSSTGASHEQPLPTESGHPTVAPTERDLYPGVKTYESRYDQEDSLRHWSANLREEQERLKRIRLNLEYESHRSWASPEWNTRLREDHAHTLRRIEELTVKVAYAKAQSPTTWFSPRPKDRYVWRSIISGINFELDKHTKKKADAEHAIATTNAANTRELRNARARLTRATKQIERLNDELDEATTRMSADALVRPEPEWSRTHQN